MDEFVEFPEGDALEDSSIGADVPLGWFDILLP